MGQVAGPHGGLAAPDADIDRDADVLPLHVPGDRRLVIVRHHLAAAGDFDAADPDPERVPVRFLAGLADRHDDTAPIGVLAGDGRLDQRRVGDGEADALCGAGGRRAGDGDLHEFGSPLAVADDLVGKVAADRFQRPGEAAQHGGVGFRIAGGAGCGDQHRIAGRGVAVHGYGVEAAFDGPAREPLEQVRRHGRVGKDIGEHRCHVRRNHARALGDARDPHRPAADLRRRRGALGEGVGGHDGARRPVPTAGCKRPRQPWKLLDDSAFRRQGLADHAGGGNEHLAFRASKRGGSGRYRVLHCGLAEAAGEGVGIARIHHDGPRAPVRQRLPAPVNRGGCGQRAGQRASDCRAGRKLDQQQVVTPLVADTRLDGRHADAADLRQVGEALGRKGKKPWFIAIPPFRRD